MTDFGAAPARQSLISANILHYRVVEKLGEGGMGTVWKAEDVRLGRPVAIKMLLHESAGDRELLARFEAEAKLASNIRHPNIVSVYDIGEYEGQPFIAMELLDGGSVRDLLDARPMKLREVLDVSIQVAEALSAAHRAGVLHRDIKPDNIFLTPDGFAKLGDFGLAKLRESSVGAKTAQHNAARTATGIVVGSPQYMSPEQARGETLDARSDLFSFAGVIYEMITGRSPFEGSSVPEVFTRILSHEAPVPPSERSPCPSALDAIVMKGLEKELQFRYQHAEDLVADLRRVRRDVDSGRVSARSAAAPAQRGPVPAARRPFRWIAAIAGAAIVAAALTLAIVNRRAQAPAAQITEVTRLTSEGGVDDDPSWSPDGRSIVYTSESNGKFGLWIRQIGGERAIFIGMRGVDEAQPAWSPDGRQIAFISSRNRGGRFGILFGSRPIEFYVYGQNADLFVIPAFGGTAVKLADHAFDPNWSPDGKSIVFRSIRDGVWRLWKVSVEDHDITPIDGVLPRAIGPAWSPDGKWIAYVAGANASTGWDLYVIPVAGGKPVQLTHDRASIALRPAWSRDGTSIVFSSTRAGTLALWEVPFLSDPPGAGAPVRVTSGVGEEVNPAWAPDGRSLAFAGVHTAPDLWRVEVATGRTEQLTNETTAEDFPRLSPDGTQLLFYSDRSGRDEVWTMNIASREMRRLSREGGAQCAWSPDGNSVAWGTATGLRVFKFDADQTITVARDLMTAYPAFSPDGNTICFQGWSSQKGYRLYTTSALGGTPRELPTPKGSPGNPSFSPDGKTIYYQTDDKLSRRNIWALDLQSGVSRQATNGNSDDAHPDVSPDGKSLLFLRNHSQIHVMPIGGGESRVVLRYESYDHLIEFPAWSRDGHSILFSLAEKSGDIFRMQEAKSDR